MPSVYINGQRRQLSPKQVIGKGGEADIYQLDKATVLKLYKRPDDADYANNPTAQAGATQRLIEAQTKLPAFPKGLPSQVVTPKELAFDKTGNQLVGYTMKYLDGMEVLLRLGDRQYREQGGIDGNQVAATFLDLHQLVQAVHTKQVVIGDFNDLNVLVNGQNQVHLVDADSMQFGQFFCRTFTTRFVDPLCCDQRSLSLQAPHTTDSDWYAFSVMLFQSLLFVGPYGGVHRPKQGQRLQHDARVLKRLTVFDGEVIYPKPALPYDALPDELLDRFERIYHQDERGVFPENLLKAMRWTTCTACGLVHARSRCPGCAAPGAVKETVVIRGSVTAHRMFRTHGRILQTAFQNGELKILYHEDGAFRREDGQVLVRGELDPELRFRISGRRTLMGKREKLFVFDPSAETLRLATDTVKQLTIFDANERDHFWVQDGQLVRSGRIGNQYIGDVLPGQTLVWVGSRLGFGFYQAGQLMRSFVFDPRGRGLNDQVPIPAVPGQLIDATCVFGDNLAWFMVSTQHEGNLVNRLYVINHLGELVAEASALPGDNTWLATGIRGHFAAGNSLFVSTDEGILRVSAENGLLSVAQTFPDTEPFVDAATQLLPANGGIYAVSSREMTLITIR